MSTVLRRALVAAAALLTASVATAVPIEEPPQPELLVEGHVVFATIDAYQYEGNGTGGVVAGGAPAGSGGSATGASRVHDAGSGLPEPTPTLLYVQRYPGVLWFNDQFLVPPAVETEDGLGAGTNMTTRYGAAVAVLVRADAGFGVREPCGGAVMAVNAGDPDPRLALLRASASTPTLHADVPDPLDDRTGDVDGAIEIATYEGRGRSSSEHRIEVDPSRVHANVTSGEISGEPAILRDMPVYVESYLLTDPNDRRWVVDKYLMTYTYELWGEEYSYTYPVWVVNILGAPVFVPDELAAATSDCDDLADHDDLDGGALCSQPVDTPSIADAPCMGYAEPSRAGFCYAGPAYDPDTGCEGVPARRYSALLYIPWEDLFVAADAADHCHFAPELGTPRGCVPAMSPAGTGCQSGSEWSCPGEIPWVSSGMDDLEGDSHPQHPFAPPHTAVMPCPVDAANPVNHGGSTVGVKGACDHHHATAAIDLYYSGSARPLPPPARDFVLVDLDGSADPFFDHFASYEG